MIFQYTWPQIVSQQKTATRRIIAPDEKALRGQYNKIIAVIHNDRTKWKVGSTYAVQPGRGQKQLARIRLTRITQQKLSRITNREALAEGFQSRQDFFDTWHTIHDCEDFQLKVWVLEFELTEVKPHTAALSWPLEKLVSPSVTSTIPCR